MNPESAALIAFVLAVLLGTEALDAIRARDLAREEAKWWFDQYIRESKQLHKFVMALATPSRLDGSGTEGR